MLTGPGNELVIQDEYAQHPRHGEGPWHLSPKGPGLGSASVPATVRQERCDLGSRLVASFTLDGLDVTQETMLWDHAERVEFRTHVDSYAGWDRMLRGALPRRRAGRAAGLPDRHGGDRPVVRRRGRGPRPTTGTPWTTRRTSGSGSVRWRASGTAAGWPRRSGWARSSVLRGRTGWVTCSAPAGGAGRSGRDRDLQPGRRIEIRRDRRGLEPARRADRRRRPRGEPVHRRGAGRRRARGTPRRWPPGWLRRRRRGWWVPGSRDGGRLRPGRRRARGGRPARADRGGRPGRGDHGPDRGPGRRGGGRPAIR